MQNTVKMDKKTLIILLGVAGLYYWDQNRQKNNFTNYRGPQYWSDPRYRGVSPPPDRRSQAWRDWVNSVVQIFGQAKSLWEPGGPFYKLPKGDIIDIVNDGVVV